MHAGSEGACKRLKSKDCDVALELHPPARFDRHTRRNTCKTDRSVRRFIFLELDRSELATWTETDEEVQMWENQFRMMCIDGNNE
jgi:hypothetical protein